MTTTAHGALAHPALRRAWATLCDKEFRALFPPAVFQQVADLIKARRHGSQTAPKSLQNLRPRAASRA